MIHRCFKRWKDDLLGRAAIIIFFAGSPAYALGSGPSWGEHSDVVQGLIALLFLIVGFFLIRAIKKWDRNQDIFFDRLRAVEADVKVIKALCDERKCDE
jgi:hypothetical protein